MSVIGYKIGKKLYEDLIGSVYTFGSVETKKTGQIKILHEEFAKQDDLVQAFHKCAENSCTIKNPNYITPQLHAHENGLHFIILEECSLIPLSILLKKTEVLSISGSIEAIKALANILRHAHLDEVSHSHLAPECIFSDINLKQFKISNFGFAEFIRLLIKKQHASLLNTLPYYSPEFIQGDEKLKRQSDIYPLGVLFYRLLVGEIPWKNQELGDYLLNPHQRAVVPPSLQRLEIPELLDELVLEALEPTVENRCPNISQFIEKLIEAKSEIIASLTPADQSFYADALDSIFEKTDETTVNQNENQKKNSEQGQNFVDTNFLVKNSEELSTPSPKLETERDGHNSLKDNHISKSDSVDTSVSEAVETQKSVTDQQNKIQGVETDNDKTTETSVAQKEEETHPRNVDSNTPQEEMPAPFERSSEQPPSPTSTFVKEDTPRPDASSETTSIPTETSEQKPVSESKQPEIKNPKIRPIQAASEAAPITKEVNPAVTQTEGEKVKETDEPILSPSLDSSTPKTEMPAQFERSSEQPPSPTTTFVEEDTPQPDASSEATSIPTETSEHKPVSGSIQPEIKNPEIRPIQAASEAAPITKEVNPAVTQTEGEKVKETYEPILSPSLDSSTPKTETLKTPTATDIEPHEGLSDIHEKETESPPQKEKISKEMNTDSSSLKKKATPLFEKHQEPPTAPEAEKTISTPPQEPLTPPADEVEQKVVSENSEPESENPDIRLIQALSEAAPITKEKNPAVSQAEGEKVTEPDEPILDHSLDSSTPQTETLKTPAATDIEPHEGLPDIHEKETESPPQKKKISNEVNTDSKSLGKKATPLFEKHQEPPTAPEAENTISTPPQEPLTPPADEVEQKVVSENNELSNSEAESENPDIRLVQALSEPTPISKKENPSDSQKAVEKITAPDEKNSSNFLSKNQEPETVEVAATSRVKLRKDTKEQARKTAQPHISQTAQATNKPPVDFNNLETEALQPLNKLQEPEQAPEQRGPEDNTLESHESPKPTETLSNDLQESDFENSLLSKIEIDKENKETTTRQEKTDSDPETNNEKNESAQKIDRKDTEAVETISNRLPISTTQSPEAIDELASIAQTESEGTFDEKEKAPEPLPDSKEDPQHNQNSDPSSLEKGVSLNLEESPVLSPSASAEDKSVQVEKLSESDLPQSEEIVSPAADKVETEPSKDNQNDQEAHSPEKDSQRENVRVKDSEETPTVLPPPVINSSSYLPETADHNDAEELPPVEERPEQQPAIPQSKVEKDTPSHISEEENVWPDEKNEIEEPLFNQADEELNNQLVQSLDSSPPAAQLPNNQNVEQSQISQDPFAQKPVVPFDSKDESGFEKEKPKSSITPNFYKKQLRGGSTKNVLRTILMVLIPITVIYLLIAITFDFNFSNKLSSLKERFITKKSESVNSSKLDPTSPSLAATLPPVSEVKLQLSVRGGELPQASDIFVNGIHYGKTNNQGRILLSNLALKKSYVIKVEKQGFETWAKEVSFSALGTKDLTVALKLLPSKAQSNGGQKIGQSTVTILLSNPQNASTALIYVNGKLWHGKDNIAPAKLQIPAGDHIIEVKKEGFRSHPASQSLTLANGENRTIYFYLIPN